MLFNRPEVVETSRVWMDVSFPSQSSSHPSFLRLSTCNNIWIKKELKKSLARRLLDGREIGKRKKKHFYGRQLGWAERGEAWKIELRMRARGDSQELELKRKKLNVNKKYSFHVEQTTSPITFTHSRIAHPAHLEQSTMRFLLWVLVNVVKSELPTEMLTENIQPNFVREVLSGATRCK